ncbi:hypothetical protein K505DRAFT_333726 [Melanomma pulvis-pyrius CBS 109.77]|uniref:Ubiquitin-like protease family profile domain-containing protein n=1 Tax=Melanomma pulvis-pyrius CBS 109.77 TaxID=1314802 RepID=A0A6A6XPJ5_9PLEO|nr:hypothetical protein K505DRAFT_333726 [Melanomma pulvis-pyrius CBS 109.77]
MTVSKLDLSSLSELPTDVAKDSHYKRSRIYDMTKESLRHKTRTMFVTASRGHQRGGLVPTKKTRPALCHRRYSIDVSTNGWGDNDATGWDLTDDDDTAMPSAPAAVFVPLETKHEETDVPIPRAAMSSLPDPVRFFVDQKSVWPQINGATFLELENSSIANEDVHLITETGEDSWWRDDILNVALELLSEKYGCKARGIEIVNCFISYILYRVGKDGDIDGNDYANYDEEKRRLMGKKWIFLPINDGFMEGDPSTAHGCHWAFVVVDRDGLTALYVDSLFGKSWHFRNLARTVVAGVGNILNVKLHFIVDESAPNQNSSNTCRNDLGPCGPFVVTATELFLQTICYFQDCDREHECFVRFDEDLCRTWRFNSMRVRHNVLRDIGWKKCQQMMQKAAVDHNEAAFKGVEHLVIEEFEPSVVDGSDSENEDSVATLVEEIEQGTGDEEAEAEEDTDDALAETY